MSEHQAIPSDINELIDVHFDGVLSDDQAEQLRAWLLADRGNAVAFAQRAQEHQHLRQAFSGERVSHLAGSIAEHTDDAISLDMLAMLEDHDEEAHLVDLTERLDCERREQRRPHPRLRRPQAGTGPRVIIIPKAAVWLGLAAAVLLAVWIGLENKKPSDTAPATAGRPSTPEPRPQARPEPPVPATLLASHRVRWSGERGPAIGNGALDIGDYRLDTGYIQVAMADGASLIIEGPAAFSIDSASRVSMMRGMLAAYVPDGAEGFIVDTPAGRVLDLGTEFGVEVAGDQTVKVHVMDGQVVASLPDGGEARSMRAGDAGRMVPAANQITTIPAHGVKFARDWEQVERAVRVSDAVRYLYDTPASVRAGALEDNEVLFLLPERAGIVLRTTLDCDFAHPGRYEQVPSTSASTPSLPAGTVVDSYLLHYDRIGTPDVLVAVQGVIHFDRPVLGIIANDRRLAATDALFQNNQARYPAGSNVTRGLEGLEHPTPGGPPVLQDVVELSADRMTLTVNLETSTGIDQLRVLLEAKPTGHGQDGGAAANADRIAVDRNIDTVGPWSIDVTFDATTDGVSLEDVTFDYQFISGGGANQLAPHPDSGIVTN